MLQVSRRRGARFTLHLLGCLLALGLAPVISAQSATAEVRGQVINADTGLAVIVNVASPVANLRKRQVEQIFTGDVADWSAVRGAPGPISIYTRNTSSGTYWISRSSP